MDLGYTGPRLVDGEFCYGRLCRSCGMEICRPANVRQYGMRDAVVCDRCWMSAAVAFKAGDTTVKGIARELNVHPKTVRLKFGRAGVLGDRYRDLIEHKNQIDRNRRDNKGKTGRVLPR
jgi:hypothetical protein